MAVLREDPYLARNFRIRIPADSDADAVTAQFSEVSGLGLEIDVVEYRAGNQKTAGLRKLPGQPRYRNLVLKRGVIGDLRLWEWIDGVAEGTPDPRNGIVELLDDKGDPVMAWKIRNAWPCRYEGPTLDADGSSVALETLEICHEGLEIE